MHRRVLAVTRTDERTPGSCNAGHVARWRNNRMRCVIVDDDEAFIQAARTLLEREGMTVTGVVGGGAEAVQRVRALRPDVVLIDIRLGEESGFEAARQLADGGLTAEMIMISSYAGEDYADLVAESPTVGLLAKSDLSAVAIRRVLGMR